MVLDHHLIITGGLAVDPGRSLCSLFCFFLSAIEADLTVAIGGVSVTPFVKHKTWRRRFQCVLLSFCGLTG